MTKEEIIEGLKLLEDNMVYFDELLNDKGEYIDVHELLFESIKALEQEPCEDAISRQAMHIELEKWITYGEYKYSNATKYLYDRIDRLPPVTPQQEACEDCISRKDAINAIKRTVSTEQIKALKRLPSV